MKFVFTDNLIAEKIRLEFGDELAGYLNFENGFTLAAMDGDKIAGFISVSVKKLPYNFENTFESFIDVIKVKKEYRRKGIARKLLSLSEKESKKREAYQIRAWSSEDKKRSDSNVEEAWFLSAFSKNYIRSHQKTGERIFCRESFRLNLDCMAILF